VTSEQESPSPDESPDRRDRRRSLFRQLLPLSVWQNVAARVIGTGIIAIGAATLALLLYLVRRDGGEENKQTTTPAAIVTPRPVKGGVAERAWHRGGTPTFGNYHDGSVAGPTIAFMARVKVSCKVKDTTVPSANPDGYWYRIKSPPWSGGFYAVANNFLNADPPAGPYTHNTDFNVPDC
jgi:hypothetical protein